MAAKKDVKNTIKQHKPPDLNLTHIYLNEKHLKHIPNKSEHENARVIFLHNNLIVKIENLSNLRNLTHLYLQWNAIKKIENLDTLVNLNKLYLGNNKISVVENLSNLKKLKELHIEKQILDSGDILCFDPRSIQALSSHLEVLSISENKLYDIEAITELSNLKRLIARNNKFDSYGTLVVQLKKLRNLREIDFRQNSICKAHRYRETIIATCPKLEMIDNMVVLPQSKCLFKYFLKVANVNKEKSKKYHKKVIFDNEHESNLSNNSPDIQLALIEKQRTTAHLARQNRLKIKDSAQGGVPRCFWRNRPPTSKSENSRNISPFENFVQNTL